MAKREMQGKWVKLDDGTWGIEAKLGGRAAEAVGSTIKVLRRGEVPSYEVLGDVVEDWGAGDWAQFRKGAR